MNASPFTPAGQGADGIGQRSPFTCFSLSRSCVIGFPLYYCFVISTQSIDEVVQKPQKMLPSTHLVENYTKVWNRIHMGRLLVNSAIVAVTVSLGKILISILSAFAIVYFNFRGKQIAFWMIFVTLMLPVPVRIISTYQVVSDPGMGRYLCRADDSIDRFGDSHLSFPAVLHDHTG